MDAATIARLLAEGKEAEAVRWVEQALVQADNLTESGSYQEALRLTAQVNEAGRSMGNLHLQAQTSASMAVLHAYLGQFDQAEEAGRSALALAKESGDTGLVAIAYLRMGQVMYQQDRYGPAYYWFKAGGDVAGEAGLDDLVQVCEEAARATGVVPKAK